MKILELVLYSKDGKKKRILEFNKNGVTIISGKDKTGKTALLEIVQYCLGSEDCRIPEGIIKENVSWYGIRLQFETEQMFIARKNPDLGRQTTNQAVYILKKEITIPETPPEEAETNIDDIVQLLTNKVGIEENLFRPELEHTRNEFEATIKHALFYCFQDQNDIGTKKYLFHKQSEEFIPQAMRDTLPYLMGAVEHDTLKNENELATKKRELTKIKKRIKEAELINSNSFSQAHVLLESAFNLGLINGEYKKLEAVEEYRQALKRVLDWHPENIVTPNYNEINNGLLRIEQLEQERRALNDKIAAMTGFVLTGENYANELEIQDNRLHSVGIYKKLCMKVNPDIKYNIPYLEQIQEGLTKVHNELENVKREIPRVLKSIEELKNKRENIDNEIEDYQCKVDALYEQEDLANRYKELNMQRGIIIGKIMLWLESSKKLESDSPDRYELNQAEYEVERLERIFEQNNIEDKTDSIINRLSNDITEFARRLGLEHSNNPIRFNLKNLTIVADRPDKPFALEKMGGAANWVGYHLAMHFALHKHFIEANCSTPRFIFLDQPSYAYFPEELKSKQDMDENALNMEDRDKIEHIYNFIFDIANELKGKLQIILTDHVILNSDRFKKDLKEVWRKGQPNEALIPTEWYE